MGRLGPISDMIMSAEATTTHPVNRRWSAPKLKILFLSFRPIAERALTPRLIGG